MKTVFFTEEQFQNLNEIGKDLFNDEQDPRSLSYIRKLNRPKINWFKIVLYFIVSLFVAGCSIFCVRYFSLSIIASVVTVAVVLIAYIALTLKQVIICTIKIYQRYAPDSLRNKCRFEPSCSEYMLLAINKYGLIKGLKKGTRRLKRCNVDGGGFDFP